MTRPATPPRSETRDDLVDRLLFVVRNAPPDQTADEAKKILGPRRTFVVACCDLLLATRQILPHELAAVAVVMLQRAAGNLGAGPADAKQASETAIVRKEIFGEAVHLFRDLSVKVADAIAQEPAFEKAAAAPTESTPDPAAAG